MCCAATQYLFSRKVTLCILETINSSSLVTFCIFLHQVYKMFVSGFACLRVCVRCPCLEFSRWNHGMEVISHPIPLWTVIRCRQCAMDPKGLPSAYFPSSKGEKFQTTTWLMFHPRVTSQSLALVNSRWKTNCCVWTNSLRIVVFLCFSFFNYQSDLCAGFLSWLLSVRLSHSCLPAAFTNLDAACDRIAIYTFKRVEQIRLNSNVSRRSGCLPPLWSQACSQRGGRNLRPQNCRRPVCGSSPYLQIMFWQVRHL